MALSDFALTTATVCLNEVNADSTKTSVIERLIHTASRAIANLAGGRVFHYAFGIVEDQRLRGRSYGPGSNLLMVSRTPVISVSTIVLVDQAGVVQYTFDSSTYNLEDLDAALIHRDLGWSCSELYRVRTTYEAGWVTPAQVDNGVMNADDVPLERTLPEDLEEAAIMTVVSLWSRRGQDREIASATSENGPLFTYRDPGDIVPQEARRIVDLYRRMP